MWLNFSICSLDSSDYRDVDDEHQEGTSQLHFPLSLMSVEHMSQSDNRNARVACQDRKL